MTTRDAAAYTTRLLDDDTWDDFARLVEANKGVWGGCWCMGFHPEGVKGGRTAEDNKRSKREHVRRGTVDLPTILNPKAYDKELVELPDWRIGCIFTGSKHREKGVARAAVAGALAAIEAAGGGLVEAYPEQVEGRKPQRGAYFHTGPEDLFTDLGFERDRQIAKWRWVMRKRV